ncbi:putative conidiation-specific protein 6 protein [Lasiodiplodia theobromae]|uniref:Conidiation-specific protein 6 n=2 Tax=Lasiodiplodia TaxID=66739 RepID=A0A5N5D2S8_9PEZI|nr:Conidiation-specific protein 6 [Lasiodiplodia theobromae]KAB2571634.1 Conidiation-specific protein 6 [Lasiodiplodia theobromae]KAF4545298.1 Conidiation-specific protein 6 [Lasiodiplodia theobromae]KAF9639039.1 putative conidiation-specific protein 6 protein [Lasiodiplodia theobromae]KAK0618682.1 Conidiation-specific protein 6 [Lasiodiplodia hormozganensis]
MSNPGNVIGGHKANLNNPNTSDEAKQHSKQVIDEHMQSGEMPQADQHKNPGNVAGGLKATLNNPNVSDEAKQSAQERLHDF